jgi:alkylhydroperoxidase family enzyme
MSRVTYREPSDLDPSDRDLLARPINLFRALANSPEALRAYGGLGLWIRHECRLDPRLRQLAILQVGWVTRNAYEFSHHIRLGEEFGVTAADVEALIDLNEGRPSELVGPAPLVVDAATEMTRDLRISDRTWSALMPAIGIESLIDLTVVIGFYNAAVRVIETLDVDIEPEYLTGLARFGVAQRFVATEGSS